MLYSYQIFIETDDNIECYYFMWPKAEKSNTQFVGDRDEYLFYYAAKITT